MQKMVEEKNKFKKCKKTRCKTTWQANNNYAKKP
jgi:hypothetical protein